MDFCAKMALLQFLLFGILAVPTFQTHLKVTSSTSDPAGSYRNQNPQCSKYTYAKNDLSCFSAGHIEDSWSCIAAGCCFGNTNIIQKFETPYCNYPLGFEKVKCLPDDVGQENCFKAGCHWRRKKSSDAPNCYKPPYNTKYKKFGYNTVQCSTDSRSHEIINSENHEISCQTESQTESSCAAQGCCWTNSTANPCIYPKYDFVPCFPDSDGNILEETCTAKGCHWISDPLKTFGNPLLTKCFYPLNYKPYRTADVPQCFHEGYTIQNRAKCDVTGDLNEMNCRAKGCCWQPVLHNASAHFCYYPWNTIEEPVQDLSICSSDVRLTEDNRFDCFPRGIPNEKTCNARGCCWNPSKGNAPSCFYPMTYKSYEYSSTIYNNTKGMRLQYLNKILAPYPDNIESVQMDIDYETENRIRVKIYDSNNPRYESPYPKIKKNSNNDTDVQNKIFKNKLYAVDVGERNFGFVIKRTASNQILFDTRSVGGFIFADQFLQISARLPSTNVYGLGLQMSKPLKNNFDWSTFSLFAQGQSASHPFYLSIENNGKAHGVFLLNSNAMEIALQPTPAITYRATGGILDFYFFMGETPSDVIMQYMDLIGKPHMPPYWALGHQFYEQGNIDLKYVQGQIQNQKYLLDVVYGNILHMDLNKDPTITANFKAVLSNNSIKYVSVVQPGIITKNNNSILIKREGGDDIYMGKLNSDRADNVYLDFTNPEITEDWKSILSENFKSFPFDGLYLENNEPLNSVNPVQCPLSRFDDPPFVPKLMDVEHQELKQKTICMSAVQHAGLHYNVHNLYGISQAHITYDVLKSMLKKVRPFILSKSTFAGSGTYSGHWIQYKSELEWDSMKQSVIDMILMNMYGVPMVGSNAYGTIKNTEDEELTLRWMSLAAFYPLSLKNTYCTPNPNNAPYNNDILDMVAKKYLQRRYRLLPYLYTVMNKAHREGQMVIRPLFFEYPNDPLTYAIDDQFFWGESILICPVLKKDVKVKDAYIPEGQWYMYPDLKPMKSIGKRFSLEAGRTDVPMLIKGGSIVVTQAPKQTTKESRDSKFDIQAFLDSELMTAKKYNCHEGQFYWDDGETNDESNHFNIQFYSNEYVFKIAGRNRPNKTIFKSENSEMLINSIQIHTIDANIWNVRYRKNNETKLNVLQFSHVNKVLNIDAAGAQLSFWNDYYILFEFLPLGAPSVKREEI